MCHVPLLPPPPPPLRFFTLPLYVPKDERGTGTKYETRARFIRLTGRLILLIIITGDNKRFEGEAMFIALRGGALSIADREDERMVRVARENNGSSAVARL